MTHSLSHSRSPSDLYDMDLQVDLDVGFDITMTKDDLLLSTLTPSSSSSSLYKMLEQPHLYRRGIAYTMTTITTTTTTTTTTSSPPISPITAEGASTQVSGRDSFGFFPASFQPQEGEEEAEEDPADDEYMYEDEEVLEPVQLLSGLGLVSEGPYLFLFDKALSLYYPIRALILFVLGFLFSVVIDHLQTEHHMIEYPSGISQLWDTASWLPPTCGAAAVLVGTIYPLGDYLWWGQRVERNNRDWSSVMRCFGGFIGVNYAASKLPWTSSLQVSCTLALISVGLWFWFDRTAHGFMISLTVASMGTIVAYFLVLNGWYSFTRADFFGVGSWIPCILYSSSVCFGSIGRQLDIVPEAWYNCHPITTHLKAE